MKHENGSPFLYFFLGGDSDGKLKSFQYGTLGAFLSSPLPAPREANVRFACLEDTELSCHSLGELDDFINLNYATAKPLPRGICERRLVGKSDLLSLGSELRPIPLTFQRKPIFHACTNGRESIVSHLGYAMHAFRRDESATEDCLSSVSISYAMKLLAYHAPEALDLGALYAVHPGIGNPCYEYQPKELEAIMKMSPWGETK